ncbi:hypothetical protein A0256_15495 [Mucilaginibacter sp. PAMC 26640]|nr:hypothetical protein A0256_15495 [Mucilaginibacter sp. PAMC 26640]
MKKHLVNLLFEQYKLATFTGQLSDLGIDLTNLLVNNYDVVLDIIGFPKDDLSNPERLEARRALPDFDPKNPADGFFSREDLYDRFLLLTVKIEITENIILAAHGLTIKSEDEVLVREKLAGHISWLYLQFEVMKQNGWS